MINDNEVSTRYADLDDAEVVDLDFEAADERLKKLQADAAFRALRLGVRGVAESIDTPELNEQMAKQALMEQYLGLQRRERPQPGPARRPKPKVSARKRQRQARKANR